MQLLKRRRDIAYKNRSDLAPFSIVLTTLAAAYYRGERSISQGLSAILAETEARIRLSQPGRLVVSNPQNSDEDLSERWDTTPHLYTEFTKFVREFWKKWTELLMTRGLPRVVAQLDTLYGEAK